MKWVKLEVKLNHDPEWGRLNDATWRFGIQLLMLAGELETGGSLLKSEDISWRLRYSAAKTAKCLAILEQIDFVFCDESGVWHICNWSEYQAPSSAKRVREHRERQKATEGKQPCNVTETLPKRPRLDKSRVDKIRLEESREEKDSAREKAKPEDVFQVVDYMQSYGQEKRYVLDFVTNGERFWDFYASKGWKVGNAAMKDWKSAARNWVRSQHERQSTGKANGIDRRSSQERANRLGVADVKDDAIGALRLIQAMRGETGHEESDGRDDPLFLGDGS